jgi:hypothetical protein
VQFSVITADDAETSYEGSYRVLDNAVLVVEPDDPGEPIVCLNPAYWRQIIEQRHDYTRTVLTDPRAKAPGISDP